LGQARSRIGKLKERESGPSRVVEQLLLNHAELSTSPLERPTDARGRRSLPDALHADTAVAHAIVVERIASPSTATTSRLPTLPDARADKHAVA
jgi:hypothetical protein